ncbi:MaoC family dehydratase [Nocardioides houyundeii]|uniref:MaoC family dehydratase n=1 Tax=Nocardioides houyundeii TaxID=2045452 RepID=UPI000DF47A9A|nr:MaoC/PaaZ C-terminal domain-containing protein [Nocardioides houyundeii]
MGVRTLARAALPAVPGINLLPGIRKVPAAQFQGLSASGPPTPIDARHVAAYSRVCGFPRRDTVPVTYPHLLGFDLHMEIMSSPEFPWPAIGTVHVENTITSHRPIALTETLGATTSVGAPRPHAKGMVLDFVTTISSGDEIVWESISSYLRRGRVDESAEPGLSLPAPPEGRAVWDLPADLGRRYGAVSGDLNPIHLYPLTAQALGFKRQIAHGMWTKARCLAAIENRLPDAVRIEVAFKKPVFLPGKVAFGLEGDRSSWQFALTNPGDRSPHLVGRTAAA